MKLLKLIIVMAILALPVAVGTAQQEGPDPAYDDQTSPVDLLASYYNAINRGEYERAYAYWEEAPNSYEDFARGFEDTETIQLIVQPPTRYEGAAGSIYVSIPTALVATHTDETEQTFVGCFVARMSNLVPPDEADEDTWYLYSADVVEVVEDDASIAPLLLEACAL